MSSRSMVFVAAAFVAWALWFVWRSSFVVDGQRVFCLFDDAMISMTYARNYVDGWGLEWSRRGDPVEGFTCPLWTLAMIPIQLLPLPLSWRPLAVQLVGIAILVVLLFAVRGLVRRHFEGSALPAVLMTATFYPLAHWSLMGMETGLQAVLTVTAIDRALTLRRDPVADPRGFVAILTASVLLRPDMLLVVLPCVAAVWFPVRRAIAPAGGPRRWATAIALGAAALLGYLAFRLGYYGDPLPNTYYLKLTGVPPIVRVVRGLSVLGDEAEAIASPLVVVGVAALVLARRRAPHAIAIVVVGLALAYSVWVGGDAWEGTGIGVNRFVAPVMPLSFVLAGDAIARATRAMSRARRPTAVAALTALACIGWSGLLHAPDRGTKWRRLLVVERPLGVDQHRQIVADMRTLDAIVKPKAIIATFWAGIPAYFTDHPMADILGYNDRHIARRPSSIALTLDNADEFRPGHNKWDWDYLLGEIEPDVIYQPGAVPKSRESELLARRGYVWRDVAWVRAGSPQVVYRAPTP